MRVEANNETRQLINKLVCVIVIDADNRRKPTLIVLFHTSRRCLDLERKLEDA